MRKWLKIPDDFVAVVFVDDMDQAREYKTLLETNDIPVKVEEQKAEHQFGPRDPSDKQKDKIAVMVPEDFQDEAFTIIESQDTYDDFYDFALEDEED